CVRISTARRFPATLLRAASREQVQPPLGDPEPTPAIFLGGGSVCPFLRIFGVAEVLFFPTHDTRPRQVKGANTKTAPSFLQIGAVPRIFCSAQKSLTRGARSWALDVASSPSSRRCS